MTGFPILRAPRQSPATAYLQHLQHKKGPSGGSGKSSSSSSHAAVGPYAPLPYVGGSGRDGVDFDGGGCSPQSVVLRKSPRSSSSSTSFGAGSGGWGVGGGSHHSSRSSAPPPPPTQSSTSTLLPRLPKPILGARSRSAQTFATCGTLCSDPSRTSHRSSGSSSQSSSANSTSSLGETASENNRSSTFDRSLDNPGSRNHFPLSFPDDFVASTGASLTTTETALVPHHSNNHHHHDDTTLPSRDAFPSPPTSTATPTFRDGPPANVPSSPATATTLADPHLLALLGCDSTDDHHHDDDDDSLVALDRLLTETSRRWSESTRQTHREFCRLSNCPCREQESIIAQQAAEIAQLRHKLQHRATAAPATTNDDGAFAEAAEAAAAEVFPLEQIEVYHDHGDDHCSVTSGLTQQYDNASLATGQHSFSGANHHPNATTTVPSQLAMPPAPDSRPDADSVTGTQSVHLTTAPPTTSHVNPKMRKAPLLPPSSKDSATKKGSGAGTATASISNVAVVRARNRRVALTAADGTTRHAVFTGEVASETGLPHGCGVLKFATGDYYMGQVQHGQMHGQGTFVVNRKAASGGGTSPKHPHQEVLKGHFERNVFTGQ